MHLLSFSRTAASRTAVRTFASHASSRGRGLQSLLEKKPNDVVITYAKRTPMGKGKKGQLHDMPVDAMLAELLKATFKETKLDPAQIDDIAVGTCHPPSPLYISRAAAIAAGIPVHVPIQTINRLCSSGLMAIRSIANSIQAGEASLGFALGVESMSMNERPTPVLSEEVGGHVTAQDCTWPMGNTAEAVAQHFNITREKQDKYALISHTRAGNAFQKDLFSEEIVPISHKKSVVQRDDTIRLGVTAESLAKLQPVFKTWSDPTITAGNASGVGDGAAIAILTTRERAEKEGWSILAKWGGCTVIGVEPRYMGIGPVVAIPKILEQVGLAKGDIDIWEINEAFASQFAYCIENLDLPMEKVNPNGGAMAISHPLGMTGVRLAITGLAELRRRNEQVLCTSMCIGSGMGAAAIFVNEVRQ